MIFKNSCKIEPKDLFDNRWCYANWIQVCLASLKPNELLSCIKGCLDRWSGHVCLKLK